MNSSSHAHLIRKSSLILGAAALISLPLMAFAGASAQGNPNYSLLNTKKPSQVQTDPEIIYVKLQNRSFEVCGSPDLHITGSVRRSTQIKNCYEGTLTAAVERLDKPEVTQLHLD